MMTERTKYIGAVEDQSDFDDGELVEAIDDAARVALVLGR